MEKLTGKKRVKNTSKILKSGIRIVMNTERINSEELVDILDFLSNYCSSKNVDDIKEMVTDMDLAYFHHAKKKRGQDRGIG